MSSSRGNGGGSMYIVWRGHGLLALGIVLLCVIVAAQVPSAFHMSGNAEAKAVHEAMVCGLAVGGIICWFWGRALRRRDGWSHTLYYIPIQWLGALIIIGNVYYSSTQLWRATVAGPDEESPAATPAAPSPEGPAANSPTDPTMSRPSGSAANPTPFPALPTWERRDRTAERASKAAAIQRYPELGVPGSPFETRWMALSQEYRETRPNYFEKPDWPERLAVDTDRLLQAKEHWAW
jgi:hypothetical protein